MARKLRVEYEGAIYHLMNRGEEIYESDERKAQELVSQMILQAGWTWDELNRRRKSAPRKVQMARRLRRETTMTWKWIAEHLTMGHWQAAANAVLNC